MNQRIRKPYKKKPLPSYRICKNCLIKKSINEFYKHRHKCKTCWLAYSREYIKKRYPNGQHKIKVPKPPKPPKPPKIKKPRKSRKPKKIYTVEYVDAEQLTLSF